MTKKFAVLAVMAAMFVACGGNSAEMEAKAKATADSLAAAMTADSIAKAAEAAAAAAQATMDSAAAHVDSAAAVVTGH